MNQHDSKGVRVVGMVLGVIASLAFIAFAAWCIPNGVLDRAERSSRVMFFALAIILGGPIPYFFVNATTRIDLTSPWGKGTFGGGYAVAVAAVVGMLHWIPEEHVWMEIQFDNVVHGIKPASITIRKAGGSAELIEVQSLKDDEPRRIICHFRPGDSTIKLFVTFSDTSNIVNARPNFEHVVRRNDKLEEISLYPKDVPSET